MKSENDGESNTMYYISLIVSLFALIVSFLK